VGLYLKRAGRLILVAWLLWFGGWTIFTLRDLLVDSSANVASDSAVGLSPSDDPAALIHELADLDAGGRWAFVDGPWSLGVVTLSTNDFAGYWAKSPADPNTFGEVAPIENTVLDLVRSMDLAPQADAPHTIYRYESADTLAEVATLEVAGRSRLAWARLAMLTAPGEWKVLEARAASPTANAPTATAADSFTIPVPAGTERLAARYDAAGALRGDFLLVDAPAEKLLDHWRVAGCSPTSLDIDTAESAAVPIRRYVLTVDRRLIHAVVWNSQTPGRTMLLALPATLPAKVSR
jgi:hypothetical protein